MSEEEVQKALQIIKDQVISRGDSFDIGNEDSYSGIKNPDETIPEVINIINNPHQLAERMNLTQKQAENIKSLIIGGGTGAVHKLLSKHIGDEPAAVIGALLSGWATRKLFKGK
jgi:riboflavin biosynthesis pyrimidine reductase